MSVCKFTVEAENTVGKFYNFWEVANWNKPFRLLESKHIDRLRGYAPFIDAVNCVYLLGGRTREHNCWFKGVDENGGIVADFTGMIDQLQAALDNGYVPWLVLDNIPYEMSDPPSENFYGNTAPPADEKVWHAYVRAAIEAMVKAFGYEQVAGWWFRVGTEPDLLPGHWLGTKQQYFDHYDYTVDAVLSVIPEALIGPGNVLNPCEGEFGTIVEDQWGLDIIDHAGGGKNAVTGETGTVMRWFSYSWYGRVSSPLSKFDTSVKLTRDRLDKYPQFADMPIKVGEFTVLHDENGTRLYSGDTTEWSASFYAGIADRVYKYNIGHVYEWHHATERVLHPKGQVIKMLRRMVDGDRLEVSPSCESDREFGLLAAQKDAGLMLLAYNHDKDRESKKTREFEIDITGVDEGSWLANIWTVDSDRGVWAYEFEADCKAACVEPIEGSGRYEGGIEFLYGPRGFEVFEANRDKYQAMAVLAKTATDSAVDCRGGKLSVNVKLPVHSVSFIKLTRID